MTCRSIFIILGVAGFVLVAGIVTAPAFIIIVAHHRALPFSGKGTVSHYSSMSTNSYNS